MCSSRVSVARVMERLVMLSLFVNVIKRSGLEWGAPPERERWHHKWQNIIYLLLRCVLFVYCSAYLHCSVSANWATLLVISVPVNMCVPLKCGTYWFRNELCTHLSPECSQSVLEFPPEKVKCSEMQWLVNLGGRCLAKPVSKPVVHSPRNQSVNFQGFCLKFSLLSRPKV